MWLVGMMGSGKTRAGRIAAHRLGVGFADTDDLVEKGAGLSVERIWSTLGEKEFRRLEREAVSGLAGFEGIVATGGGVLLDDSNHRVMGPGIVVWLRASPGALAARLEGTEGRPLLGSSDPVETLRDLLESREALYQKAADRVIDTDGLGIEEVAGEIEALWSG